MEASRQNMLREVGLRSVGFVRRQANDIRTDGLEALSRKLRRVRSSFLENWKTVGTLTADSLGTHASAYAAHKNRAAKKQQNGPFLCRYGAVPVQTRCGY